MRMIRNSHKGLQHIVIFFTMIAVLFMQPAMAFALSDTSPVTVELAGSVSYAVAGRERTAEAGQFLFRTAAVSGNISTPDKTYLSEYGGRIGLGSYVFYRAGDYVLNVTQANQGQTGYTYDLSPVTVTFHIREHDGELTADVEYRKNGEEIDGIAFSNSYTGDTKYAVTAACNQQSYKPGDLLTLTVTVRNTGDLALHGVYLRQYVPAGCTFQSASGGEYGAVRDKDHATRYLPSLDYGESVSMQLTVRVNECCPDTLTFTPLYEVTGNENKIYTNDPVDPGSGVKSVTLKIAA